MAIDLTLPVTIAVRLWAPAAITAITILRRRPESRRFKVLSLGMMAGIVLDVGYYILVAILAFPGQGAEAS